MNSNGLKILRSLVVPCLISLLPFFSHSEWTESLPLAIKPSPDMLGGLALRLSAAKIALARRERALTSGSGGAGDVFVLLDEETMSAEPTARFKELFEYVF